MCPYNIPTLRTSSTPWFCGYRRHTPFARYESKYENKLDGSKRFTYEKRSSHAESSGRKCLKKNTEQFTASTSFNTFRSVLLTLEITNPTTVHVERASRRQPHSADALYGPGRYENILRMESQELGISNRISEDVARSELETMERDARCALFCYDQKFKIAVWEHQRQAREAVSQAVQESFDSYDVVMMLDIQGTQNRYEGRQQENERRVAQLIGSEARDALRGQRSHMLHEHQVLLQAREREKEFVKSQMQSELQSRTMQVIEEPYMTEKFNKSKLDNTWNTRRHNWKNSCKQRISWWRLQKKASKKTQKVRGKL